MRQRLSVGTSGRLSLIAAVLCTGLACGGSGNDDDRTPASTSSGATASSEAFSNFGANEQELIQSVCEWAAQLAVSPAAPVVLQESVAQFPGFDDVNFLSIANEMSSGTLGRELALIGDDLRDALRTGDLERIRSVAEQIGRACNNIGWAESSPDQSNDRASGNSGSGPTFPVTSGSSTNSRSQSSPQTGEPAGTGSSSSNAPPTPAGNLRVFFYTIDQSHDCTWPPGQTRYALGNFQLDPLTIGVAWDEESHAGYYEVGFTVDWGDGSPPVSQGDARLSPPDGWGANGAGYLYDAYVQHQYADIPAVYEARISYEGTAWGKVGTNSPSVEWTFRDDPQPCSGFIELHVEVGN